MTRFCAVIVVVLGGCLRAPIEGDPEGMTEGDDASSTGLEDVDGPGMSGPIWPTTGAAEEGTADSPPDCHPSYVPCLPVVDDLDCTEVRAMGAAPVDVVGEDLYGLDADHDGIGCEP